LRQIPLSAIGLSPDPPLPAPVAFFVSEDPAKRVRSLAVDSQTRLPDHPPVLLDFDDR
jgi:hypothetical protein